MKPILDAGKNLVWSQPAMRKREYELRAGDELVATMRWDKTDEHDAVCETDEGKWTLHRKGFLKPTLSVRGPKGASATFEVAWTGGGRLQVGADEYRWAPSTFWRSEWTFSKGGEAPAVTYRPDSSPLKAGAQVEIAGDGANVPLLVVMGWYLLVLLLEDTAIVGV